MIWIKIVSFSVLATVLHVFSHRSMDTNHVDLNNCNHKPLASSEEESQKVGVNKEEEEDEETSSLLLPRRGGISKKPKKPPRKVQWNDRTGNKLVEILEFQPSDASDSDDDDLDSCICTIM